jgi:hypothetical protein
MSFDLKSIRTGINIGPPRIVLYGVPGIGKTTWASKSPSPIFIPTEDGAGALDIDTFPLAEKYEDILQSIGTLLQEKHKYQTVVIDAMEGVEMFMHRYIVERLEGAESISDNSKGSPTSFGKGLSIFAPNEMTSLLQGFEALRRKGMSVILIGHSTVAKFSPPDLEAYDRYSVRLEKRSLELIKDWSDAILFANYRTFLTKDDEGFGNTRARGKGVGERVVFTEERPAFIAKNRYGLPSEMPMEYSAFASGLTSLKNKQESK